MRLGLHWLVEHFLAYFVLTLVFCLATRRPMAVAAAVYVLALVPIQVFLPLALALLLWPIRRARAQGLYRLLLFAPTVVSFSM